MAQTLEAQCEALVRAYGLGAPTNVSEVLVKAQARRAAKLVEQSNAGNVLALPDPVGTGKTVVALCYAAMLLRRREVGRILVVAPNAFVAKLWVDRAEQLDRGLSPTEPFKTVRSGQRGLRWQHSELRVVTRASLTTTPKPEGGDTLIIVDEAHRGLQNRGAFYTHLKGWIAGKRTLLVTATPFQLSTTGVLTMLEVDGGPRIGKERPDIEDYGRGLVRLTKQCVATRADGKEPASDPQAKVIARDVKTSAGVARKALERFILPPDPAIEHLSHHPKLQSLDGTSSETAVRPVLVDLGDFALVHHVARTVPELLRTGKGDMFNRQIVSSSEGFWASKAGRDLRERTDAVLSAAHVTPKAAERLSAELKRELGDGADHPKVAETTSWVSKRILAGRHVLVFCVFKATRDALKRALVDQLGEDRVVAPTGDGIPPKTEKLFRKEPPSSDDAIALILQDRFSESIDLDGGRPCLVHHDLPWNPARLSQRWGRAVRASSDFQPIAVEDIFIPVLNTEVDKRLYETVRGRWEIGDLLLPKKASYDGHGAIPVEFLEDIAREWQT